jgi:O-antigen/teichoic acid export membrane protein
MGPEILGRLNFATAFVSFFVLAASLAMPLYGAREIAKARDERESLDRTFSELFCLNLMTSLASFAVFVGLFPFSERIRQDHALFAVTGSAILFNCFNIEWLFQGLENYKSIAWRNLLFKSVSLASLFALVHRKEDFLWAAGITVASNAGCTLLGFLTAGRFATLSWPSPIRLRGHLEPMAALSSSVLFSSMYVFLDSVLLGYLSGNTAVGLFTAATRAVRVPIAMLQSLAAVVIPRFSYYLKRGMVEEQRVMARKSISFIYMTTFPVVGALLILAPAIVRMISGPGFMEAVPAMRITAPLVAIMGFSNFLGLQVIFPNGGDRKLMVTSLLAASLDLGLNLILIPRFGYLGTAIALVAAEAGSLLTLCAFSRGTGFGRILFNGTTLRYAAAAGISSGIIFLVSKAPGPAPLIAPAAAAVGAACYLAFLWLAKDPLTLEILGSLAGKIMRIHPAKPD